MLPQRTGRLGRAERHGNGQLQFGHVGSALQGSRQGHNPSPSRTAPRWLGHASYAQRVLDRIEAARPQLQTSTTAFTAPPAGATTSAADGVRAAPGSSLALASTRRGRTVSVQNLPWRHPDASTLLNLGGPLHQPSAAAPVAAPLTIVFVAAEVAPWSKTGGLGDVMGALPKALAAQGHQVMVVAPRYLSAETEARYKGLEDTGVIKGIDLGPGGGFHTVSYHHQHADHVDWVFVDHISYHRPGSPYGNGTGVYEDNLFRFALLSMAAIEATLVLPIGGRRFGKGGQEPFGQRCVFVANDWHASMVPLYLKARFRPHGVHTDSRCVLALHNLAHQGSFPPAAFPSLGLGGEWYAAMEWVVTEPAPGEPGPIRPTHTINVLKAALVTADKLVTVSQAYAAEICTEKHGAGLHSLLKERAEAMYGIINGIDTSEWDPATDKHLPMNYSAADEDGLLRKAACKAALQRELGLPVDSRRPLLGFIGRLDFQKGPDLVLDGLERLVGLDCQVVILGSGAADYEAQVQQAQADYPYFVRGITKFDVPMAHKLMAGCDMLLMPSRFEPCGLNQLYAMRYGTITVAHATGGLRDTIQDFNEFAPPGTADRGTGWTFAPAETDALVDAVGAAVRVFAEEPAEWARLQQRCMAQDLSWDQAARQYATVFQEVMADVPLPQREPETAPAMAAPQAAQPQPSQQPLVQPEADELEERRRRATQVLKAATPEARRAVLRRLHAEARESMEFNEPKAVRAARLRAKVMQQLANLRKSEAKLEERMRAIAAAEQQAGGLVAPVAVPLNAAAGQVPAPLVDVAAGMRAVAALPVAVDGPVLGVDPQLATANV